MRYKTIILELLEQQPAIYERLRSQRKLLLTVERFALELKSSHEVWKGQLLQSRPDSDPALIASEALELAIQETERSLFSDLQEEEGGLSLDAAIEAIRPDSRPA